MDGQSFKQASISLIRTISLGLIILCHITQWFGLEIAWWLNIGVQLFLLISGFLYGQKTIEIKTFIVKRLKKLLIPYYVVFVVAVIMQFLFFRQYIEIKYALGGMLLRSTIKGGQHLWFVPTIILCYLITPFLQEFRPNSSSKKQFTVYSVACFVFLSVILGVYQSFFNPAWISCYAIGYMIGINNCDKLFDEKLILWVSGILATICNGIVIWCTYVKRISFTGYNYFCDYSHVILAVFLFIILKLIFDSIRFNNKVVHWLDVMDHYSYDTYLVHHFLILGPFSLMELTGNLPVNIIIILLAIVFLSILLNKIEAYIDKFIQMIKF